MWVVADLDDDYIAKMEDVLEIYEQPYDPRQPVICLDEKPVTLHADVRPTSPAQPGREARRDNEYERCGTANVFCAVEPKAGHHFTFATPDRSGFEFAQVAVKLAMAYPSSTTRCSTTRKATMDDELMKTLRYLRLRGLLAHWDEYVTLARQKQFSPVRLLRHVVEEESKIRQEHARQLRLARARIPELWRMETFPFERQPRYQTA